MSPFSRRVQGRVLVGRRQRGEALAEGVLAVRLDVGDRRAIQLRRRQGELVALLGRSFGERPFHVPGGGLSVRTGELAVDEDGDRGSPGAQAVVAVGDETLRGRIDEIALARFEVSERVGVRGR